MARTKHQLFDEEIDDKVFDTGTKHLSRLMPISQLVLDKEFEAMFPLDKEGEKGVEQIAENMKLHGYDESQPIHVWVHTEKDQTVYTPIDGHRRRAAAISAGLQDIPVFEHRFNGRKEALLYAMSLQIDRRNLNDADFLSAVTKFMELGGTRKQGNLKEILSARTGVSERTVAKAMVVAQDKKASEDVKKRKKSVNEAYKEIQKKKKKKESAPAKEIPLVKNEEKLESNETPSEDLESEMISIRQEGFADGFWKALVFVLSEAKKGKTPEEIYHDQRLQDLSPQVICNFAISEEAENLILGW